MTIISNDQILIDAHHQFARGLSRLAILKVHNIALSEDLVQETFMKTWRYLENTGRIELMRAFLYHVLNRLIIDEYRKKKMISLDLLTEEGLELEVINSEHIFNIIEGKELAALIEKLPELYRKAIKMRYIEELPLVEMASLAHQSQNTMSIQVHRGLKKLRTLYERRDSQIKTL